jgi:uncharacterized protein (DUF1800 family)
VAVVPRYEGTFGRIQAERLLWRAGFGGGAEEADALAAKGIDGAVRSLTRPAKTGLRGPKPKDDGDPLAPYDSYGHDVLHWLDRMVRTEAPAIERMALIWHDWFATGDVSSQRLSLKQVELFRKHALGSFEEMLLGVTQDPAMLIWLSGIYNTKYSPNENYGRELMELFTLGVSDDTGYPYSEDDVREQARALTGWTARYKDDVGYVDFEFKGSRHDKDPKTIFGQTGNFDWEDSCGLCLNHQAHAPYFTKRLWAHFVPVPADPATQQALEELYVDGGYAIRPLVEAILAHPDLYEGPSLIKAPMVAIAGMLRARGRGVDTNSWTWISEMAGQRPFRPPNVSGWDEQRWLDTASFRGRWYSVAEIIDHDRPKEDRYSRNETPQQAVDKALKYWGNPTLSPATLTALVEFGEAVEGEITDDWQRGTFRALRQNALRALVATSPDQQAS